MLDFWERMAMVTLNMLFYFGAICGALAIIAPMLTSPVSRFVFGTVLGIIATTTWPAAKLLIS